MTTHGTDFYDQIMTTEPEEQDDREAEADRAWEEYKDSDCLDRPNS